MRVSESYGKLPLSFEGNQGQFDSKVRFVSRSADSVMYLRSTEAVLKLSDTAESEPTARRTTTAQTETITMRLVGARPEAKPTGIGELPGKSNYFIGSDPRNWITGIHNYSKVRFESMYRGIDLVYYGDQRNLEYDFELGPGANPAAIRLSFEGANQITLDRNGDLLLTTPDGKVVRHKKPVASQEKDGKRTEVRARYRMNQRGVVRFKVARYDRSRKLVIDPVLVYSTFLGGSGNESGAGIAVDGGGNAYIVEDTTSMDFPTVNPLQPTPRGIFVSKLNSSGSALVYSTYLGGGLGENSAGDIAVDSSGNSYVTGWTSASDFPTMNALQPQIGGQHDAFVCKLNSTGDAFIYSTYLGGAKDEHGLSIAADSSGNTYVTGETLSLNFPIANALQPNRGASGTDAFVAKIDPTGSAFVYSTYIGGSLPDSGHGITTDSAGNAYVVGDTYSADFPIANALQPTLAGTNLYSSTDGGDTWTSLNNGITGNASIATLAIDPERPSTLYEGAYPGGIFKSLDSGASWKASSDGLSLPDQATGIAADPTNSSRVYAATFNSVSRSTNGGKSWTRNITVGTDGLAIDPASPSTIYAASVAIGLVKSTDAGTSWFDISPVNDDSIWSVAIDPANTSTVYCGGQFATVHKSTNGGGSWSAGAGAFPDVVVQLAIDPVTTSTLYAVSDGFWKSTNGGVDWSNINNDMGRNGQYARCIGVDPITPSTLYAGTDGGLFKSTNGGSNWILINAGLNPMIRSLAIDPTSPSKIYVGANSAEDAFVAKLNPSGTALLYSTFLGGEGDDGASSLSVDSSGNAYIAGTTTSARFLTASSLRKSSGDDDAFVAKVNPAGTGLSFLTFVGGSGSDAALGITVDGTGNAYITGGTLSTDFPLTIDALPLSTGSCPNGICFRAFVTKVNTLTGSLRYSTYLGAVSFDRGIAVDLSCDIYVTGETDTADFPTTVGALDTSFAGTSDAFVSKIGFAGASPFDFCLQDDASGSTLQINSSTGDYQFLSCDGVGLAGTATVARKGCRFTLQDTEPDRTLIAKLSTCNNTATVSIQMIPQGTVFNIVDSNITNNSCICSGNRKDRR
jgi:hypothetical protein